MDERDKSNKKASGSMAVYELPENFNINDLGKIDLKEAERIAQEDVLFLNENDLIEGLEDFELIPLDSTPVSSIDEGQQKASEEDLFEKSLSDFEKIIKEDMHFDEIDFIADNEFVLRKTESSSDIDSDDKAFNQIFTPESALESTPESALESTPESALESTPESTLESTPESALESTTEKVDVEISKGLLEEENFSSDGLEEIDFGDPVVLSDENEQVISDESPSGSDQESDFEITAGSVSEQKDTVEDFADIHELEPVPEFRTDMGGETPHIISDSVLEPAENSMIVEEVVNFDDEPEFHQIDEENVPQDLFFKDALSRDTETEPEFAEVVFIDDVKIVRASFDSGNIFEANELEKLTSDILIVNDGTGIVLPESDTISDRSHMLNIMPGLTPIFEDMLSDFEDEHKYKDEEIEFVRTSIIEEDFNDYLNEIDDFNDKEAKKGVTTALEILGLTTNEIDNFNESLFKDEFKSFNQSESFYMHEYPLEGIALSKKKCTYITPFSESLTDSERESIERDIKTDYALIYEEDVVEIRNQLYEMIGEERANEKFRGFDGTPVIEEILPEELNEPGPEETASTNTEIIKDITDSVVILENDSDIERFLKEFPEKQREGLKGLFKYLDGLFEKLPENTIKNFAQSEYFDLYVKVLNELGV